MNFCTTTTSFRQCPKSGSALIFDVLSPWKSAFYPTSRAYTAYFRLHSFAFRCFYLCNCYKFKIYSRGNIVPTSILSRALNHITASVAHHFYSSRFCHSRNILNICSKMKTTFIFSFYAGILLPFLHTHPWNRCMTFCQIILRFLYDIYGLRSIFSVVQSVGLGNIRITNLVFEC